MRLTKKEIREQRKRIGTKCWGPQRGRFDSEIRTELSLNLILDILEGMAPDDNDGGVSVDGSKGGEGE